MQIQAKCLLLIPLLASTLLLTGCATAGKDMIPRGGSMTMPQIYKQETGGGNSSNIKHINSIKNIRAKLSDSRINRTSYVSYTSTSKNQINSIFKPLANPQITIYIYPHLVHMNGEAYPKPAVTTDFFLYKSNHFAMPNEKY
ncbi:MAG: TIGR03751 family conjugal transfer lipoprotein [Thiotrichales bacterium]|nr:MAG: TIGR03751 family conjugal transfer lipoprotein [Thiotrichales bacterium]